MSNFVHSCRNKRFTSIAMPVPSNTACCIYDKCVKKSSLAYMWHLKRNKIHLHIIRLFSSFTVFRKFSLYESQRSHTHDYTLAPLTHYIHTYTITQYILAQMCVHTYTVLSYVVSLKCNNFRACTNRSSNTIYN